MINKYILNSEEEKSNSRRAGNTSDNENNITKKKSTKCKIGMTIWIAITLFVYYQVVILGLYTIGKVEKDNLWLYNGVNGIVKFFVGEANKLEEKEYTAKVAGLGNIYITKNMLKGSQSDGKYDFSEGTERIQKTLKDFDFVLASLNTAIDGKAAGKAEKNIYNAPIELIDMLKENNITTLATATSHILDKNVSGLKATIKNLNDKEIKQIGISDKDRKNPIILIKDEIKIGVVSYTTKSNVKYKEESILNVFNEDDLKKDIEFLNLEKVDFIIGYLNIPNEDKNIVSATQKKNTEIMFNAGVNVVFGTGSMFIQEDDEDEITIKDKKVHIYTIYSLGDFIGDYSLDENKINIIGNIEFSKKTSKNKKGEIVKEQKDMKVKKPIGIYTNIDKNNKKDMYIIDDEVSLYMEKKSKLTEKEYTIMKEGQNKIVKLYE